MPWTTPKTNFVNGDVLTATQMNDVGNNLQYLYDENPDAVITTKGDLIAGNSTGDAARLAVGTDGQYLVADSTAANGVKWATPAAKPAWSSAASGSFSGSSVSITGLTGDRYLVIINDMSNTASGNITLTFNSDTGSNYQVAMYGTSTSTSTSIALVPSSSSTASYRFIFMIENSGASPRKLVAPVGGSPSSNLQNGFQWINTASISSIQIANSTGTFDAGTYEIWKYE